MNMKTQKINKFTRSEKKQKHTLQRKKLLLVGNASAKQTTGAKHTKENKMKHTN